MDVGLAEIDVPFGIALAEAWRHGKDADRKSKHHHRKAAATQSSRCHDVTPALSLSYKGRPAEPVDH
jgi:hypothetical protein